MVTIVDVANRASVSTMTVSRVINNATSVSESTRTRVLLAMQELNYVPNSIARSLVSGRTHTLGLIIADLTNPFFTTLARGAEDAAHKHMHRLVICNHDDDIDKERTYIEALISARVDGMVITPASNESAANLNIIKQHRIPFIFVDRIVNSINADHVVGDSMIGAYELTTHLLRQGHRQIGIVSGPLNIHTASERFKGYQAALTDFGVEIRQELVLYMPYGPNVDTAVPAMDQGIRTMLSQNPMPTAIFALNNVIAIQVLRTLRRLGLTVPEDVALACFEEVDPYELMQLDISTAIQPAYALGEESVHMLFRRIENPDKPYESVVLKPRLQLRSVQRK